MACHKDKPPETCKSPDLIFESIEVATGQNIISPGHINMLAKKHSTLDHRLSGRPQIYPHKTKTEINEGCYSPELSSGLEYGPFSADEGLTEEGIRGRLDDSERENQ